jgi:tagatose-6-phosphate ketose/aldose isomerase
VAAPESLENWLQRLSGASVDLAALVERSPADQQRLGYYHTLREIAQQPLTWPSTARLMVERLAEIDAIVNPAARPPASMLLTGSGSSYHAAECLMLPLQAALGVPVLAVPAGLLLTHAQTLLPRDRSAVLVSIARSGDSPESSAAMEALLQGGFDCRHLIITCNREGRLATAHRDRTDVVPIVLDSRTNDRSLVMTSSFTNLVLAGRLLGLLRSPARYEEIAASLSAIARDVLTRHLDPLARSARSAFRSALFLGTGSRFGAAREAALKMLEMSAGRVTCSSFPYLELRHGPMAAVHDDTLIVAFLASDPRTRAYEVDLLEELDRKGLGARKVIVGANIPVTLLSGDDVAVECAGAAMLSDDDLPIVDVVVGQVLAFFRCLHLGLRSDAPSPAGIINRVVANFTIYR